MPLVPGAEPCAAAGTGARDGRTAPVGVLLLHGYCGSPASMRPWAAHLAAAGLAVDVPRLPGHGTTWRELRLTRWPDWAAEADRSLSALRARCEQVVVGGLSVGACLALHLAQERGADVTGLVLVNPAVRSDDWRERLLLPWLRFLVPAFPGIVNDVALADQDEVGYDRLPLQSSWSLTRLWDDVRRRLPQVDQPVVVLHAPQDHLIPASSTRTVLQGISSVDVTDIVLPRSYHVATLDHDAETIFTSTVDLARRLAPLPAGAAA